MKTFIINLERSAVRRAQILNQVSEQKLDFEFIKAVDGAQLSEAEVKELMDAAAAAREPLKLTRGSLGCLLSHLKVYKQIVAQNLEMALVLEDDAVLPANISDILLDISPNISKNEVILLYYTSFTPCELSQRDAVALRGKLRLLYPVKPEQPFCAAAYVITREAARALLSAELPMKTQCDEWGYFYEQRAIESFRCVYPVPVRVSGAKSTIERFDYSPLRVYLTKFFDNHQIPILSQFLRNQRLSKVKETSVIKIIDEPSPISRAVKQKPLPTATHLQTQSD